MFIRVCAPCTLEGFRGGQGYGLALWERGKEESWRQEQRGELSCLMLSSAGLHEQAAEGQALGLSWHGDPV